MGVGMVGRGAAGEVDGRVFACGPGVARLPLSTKELSVLFCGRHSISSGRLLVRPL